MFMIYLKRAVGLMSVYGLVACTQPSDLKPRLHPEQQLQQLTRQASVQWFEQHPIAATLSGIHDFDHVYGDQLSIEARQAVHQWRAGLHQTLHHMDDTQLSESSKWLKLVMEYRLNLGLRGEAFPMTYLPINPFENHWLSVLDVAQDSQTQPLITRQDYENLLSRLNDFSHWLLAAETSMREGIIHRVVLARSSVDLLLSQLRPYVAATAPDSVLFDRFNHMPASFVKADVQSLQNRFSQVLTFDLLPQLTQFVTFLETEYRPYARVEPGWWALPNGQAWYRYLIQQHVAADAEPEQLHNMGKQAVLNYQMRLANLQILQQGHGALMTWLQTHPAMVREVDRPALEARWAEQLTQHFGHAEYFGTWQSARIAQMPEALILSGYPQRIEAFYLQQQASLTAPTASSPFASMIASHFKMTASDRDEEPIKPIFAQSLILYVEALAFEKGWINQPSEQIAYFKDQLLAAAAMVIDTGIHANAWSRAQAAAYLKSNTWLRSDEISAMIDQSIATPARLMTAKVQQQRLMKLLTEAEQSLAASFSLKTFHQKVLEFGTLPITLVEQKVHQWLKQQTAS
ncbi:MAG: DUF885 domain-containing protein [Shewanellaceae bacterium]|nr:DUF885 domain-containing protein [Shewanellaceae bacterium]